jgi:2-hydroxy-6-oxonona-2,4-dienedioate hydrolase
MLNYRRVGSGPTVVLQHGFLGGSGYWSPVMAELATVYDVVAPDLPGFAGSAAESVPDSIAGYADVLASFMDTLSIERFSIVGHSMGGIIAQQLALDHPDRIERLVLYGTAPCGDLPTRFETWAQTIDRFERLGLEASADVVASWFVGGTKHPLYEFAVDTGRGFTVPAAVNAMNIVPRWDIRDRVASITAPTLVIAGDRDRATTPGIAMSLWGQMPNSHLCIVPGCSHAIHLERTAIFNEVVGAFLRDALTLR